MGGTFGSFATGLGGLRAAQVTMDVAGSNITQASTEGYSRRRVETSATSGVTAPALWSRADGVQGQVQVDTVRRLSDALLDARVRREHGTQAYLDVRVASLSRVETGVGEPGDTGLNSALASLRTAFADLANHPGVPATRSQVLARASDVAQAFAAQTRNVTVEEGDQRAALLAAVTEANTIAHDLGEVNRRIAVGTLADADTGSLMDQRDQLALRLASLVGAQAVPRADGGLDVRIGDEPLVVGANASRLSITSGVTATGGSDGGPVTLAVHDGATSRPVTPGSGVVAGITELLDVTLPRHRAGLDVAAEQLAAEVNALTTSGYDAQGRPGLALFTVEPGRAAATLSVAVTDPSRVTAASVPGGSLDGSLALALARTTGTEQTYQRLVGELGTASASAGRLAATQKVLTAQVDASREQLSGVNLDEETVTMVQAQRSYEAASRLISTLDSLMDTLINRTGLGR